MGILDSLFGQFLRRLCDRCSRLEVREDGGSSGEMGRSRDFDRREMGSGKEGGHEVRPYETRNYVHRREWLCYRAGQSWKCFLRGRAPFHDRRRARKERSERAAAGFPRAKAAKQSASTE